LLAVDFVCGFERFERLCDERLASMSTGCDFVNEKNAKATRKTLRRIHISRYVADFWSKVHAQDQAVENYKLATYMNVTFGTLASDESTWEEVEALLLNYDDQVELEENKVKWNKKVDDAEKLVESAKTARKEHRQIKEDWQKKMWELGDKEKELKEKERRLDARGTFTGAEEFVLNLVLAELDDEASLYKSLMRRYCGQSEADSEELLGMVRRGEKHPPLPESLEKYHTLCLKLKGIGQVPVAVEVSREWQAQEPQNKTPVGRPREEPPNSTEDAKKKKRKLQASQRKSKDAREQMKALHAK